MPHSFDVIFFILSVANSGILPLPSYMYSIRFSEHNFRTIKDNFTILLIDYITLTSSKRMTCVQTDPDASLVLDTVDDATEFRE